MNISKLVPILEEVKKLLSVKVEGPGTQSKSSQSNTSSTSAAKAKLAELIKKSKTGVSDTTTVKATGSKKK